MKLTFLLSLLAVATTSTAWRILNFQDGGCDGSGSIISGTDAESTCRDIDPSVFGVEFDAQDEDLVLDFYGDGCPNGPIGATNDGTTCMGVCFDGGCWSQVKINSAFS